MADVFTPESYEEIGPVTITAIRDLAGLTTVETVQSTVVEKGTDEGWLAWARGDSLWMFAVARIGAGVDLGELTVRDVTVDEEGVVELQVSAATIHYVDPDEDATQVLERDVGSSPAVTRVSNPTFATSPIRSWATTPSNRGSSKRPRPMPAPS